MTRELLGARGRALDGHVVALTVDEPDPDRARAAGAPTRSCGSHRPRAPAERCEEDVAAGAIAWVREPASRGRSSRRAPRGDARSRAAPRPRSARGSPATRSGFELDGDRLVAWKPAFGGQLVAAIHADSPTQMATVRAGMLPELAAASASRRRHATLAVDAARPRARARPHPRRRPRPARRGDAVVGVGQGVAPEDYARARAAARRARRRARRDPQGDRQGLAPPRPPDRHHRPQHRAAPLRGARREREVQPHGRRARRAHGARDQHRPGRARLRRRRRRHRRRLARRAPAAPQRDHHDVGHARDDGAPPRRSRVVARDRDARPAPAAQRSSKSASTTTSTDRGRRRSPRRSRRGRVRRRRWSARRPGTLQSPELDETSGLVVSAKNPGTLWLNNDSGDSARVFAVTPNGALQGIYPLEGATAIDWEDLAIGSRPEGEHAVPLRRRHRRQRRGAPEHRRLPRRGAEGHRRRRHAPVRPASMR